MKDQNNLYWYQYTLRGFSPGCQPSGVVKHIENVGRYGIIAYEYPLNENDLLNYDLIPYDID